MKKTLAIFAVAAMVTLSGCATNEQTGALIGGVGGAAIGNSVGGLGGAAIGGAIGGIGGAAIGNNTDRRIEQQRQYERNQYRVYPRSCGYDRYGRRFCN